MMSFSEAIKQCLRKYVDFSGRAARAEYWWWVLATVACIVILGILASSLPGISGILSIVESLFVLAVILPTVAVTTRRLHDIGKTGWWQLAWVPMSAIGWIFALLGATLTFGAFLFGAIFGFDEGTASVGLGIGSVLIIIGLVILAGTYIWIIAWLARQGDAGPNQHGPAPRTP